MTNVVQLPIRVCCVCGERATKTLELIDIDNNEQIKKLYCDAHFPAPLDEDGLRLLVDQRDAEIEGLKKITNDQAKTIDRLLAALRKYEPDPLTTNRTFI